MRSVGEGILQKIFYIIYWNFPIFGGSGPDTQHMSYSNILFKKKLRNRENRFLKNIFSNTFGGRWQAHNV